MPVLSKQTNQMAIRQQPLVAAATAAAAALSRIAKLLFPTKNLVSSLLRSKTPHGPPFCTSEKMIPRKSSSPKKRGQHRRNRDISRLPQLMNRVHAMVRRRVHITQYAHHPIRAQPASRPSAEDGYYKNGKIIVTTILHNCPQIHTKYKHPHSLIVVSRAVHMRHSSCKKERKEAATRGLVRIPCGVTERKSLSRWRHGDQMVHPLYYVDYTTNVD